MNENAAKSVTGTLSSADSPLKQGPTRSSSAAAERVSKREGAAGRVNNGSVHGEPARMLCCKRAEAGQAQARIMRQAFTYRRTRGCHES